MSRVPTTIVVLLTAAMAACGTPPPVQVAPAPLTADEADTLDLVYAQVERLLVMELVRPAASIPSREDTLKVTRELRLALMQVRAVRDNHEGQYAVSRALGAIYATGISVGWPASPQLAEMFLQEALEQDPRAPDAWALLGMVHLLTGDVEGAIYYLEGAQALTQDLQIPTMIALGQAYHLSGRSGDAVGVLNSLLRYAPNNELARVMRDVIRIAHEEQTLVFRVPTEFAPNAFRPEEVQAAVNFPEVQYRNTRHGFSVAYPFDWTLHDEEIAYPLGPCTHLAEVTLDMPITPGIPQSTGDRVRVLAFPVGFGTTSREFEQDRLPIYRYPDTSDDIEAVLEDSIQQHYVDTSSPVPHEGEMVFMVRGQIGFFFHLIASPTTYEARRADFAVFLDQFSVLSPGVLAPPGCANDAPAAFEMPMEAVPEMSL